jgi:23S rRNA (adenine2030-N6)-methyltransferase
VLCETQGEEAAALRGHFRTDKRVHVHQRDGYAAMNALLPPAERRGLVLVDPPFEQQAQEFRVIETALQAAHTRWPNGICAVWYPIKKRATVMPFQRWLGSREWRGVLMAELLVQPDDSPLRLNGCGMVIVNAPWQFDATLAKLLTAAKELLAQQEGATQRLQVLA